MAWEGEKKKGGGQKYKVLVGNSRKKKRSKTVLQKEPNGELGPPWV